MTDPLFSTNPTVEDISRYVLGLHASAEAISSAVNSSGTVAEKANSIIPNIRYIDQSLSSPAIKEAFGDVTELLQIRQLGLESVLVPPSITNPVISQLESHLGSLGL